MQRAHEAQRRPDVGLLLCRQIASTWPGWRWLVRHGCRDRGGIGLDRSAAHKLDGYQMLTPCPAPGVVRARARCGLDVHEVAACPLRRDKPHGPLDVLDPWVLCQQVPALLSPVHPAAYSLLSPLSGWCCKTTPPAPQAQITPST